MTTLKAKRAGSNSFQVLKDYDSQPKMIYTGKLSAIIEGERKTSHDINKPNLGKVQEVYFGLKRRMSIAGRL